MPRSIADVTGSKVESSARHQLLHGLERQPEVYQKRQTQCPPTVAPFAYKGQRKQVRAAVVSNAPEPCLLTKRESCEESVRVMPIVKHATVTEASGAVRHKEHIILSDVVATAARQLLVRSVLLLYLGQILLPLKEHGRTLPSATSKPWPQAWPGAVTA